jgi:hypothetical protein
MHLKGALQISKAGISAMHIERCVADFFPFETNLEQHAGCECLRSELIHKNMCIAAKKLQRTNAVLRELFPQAGRGRLADLLIRDLDLTLVKLQSRTKIALNFPRK